MLTAMTPDEFAEWEPQQPVRFALKDGQPMRLPEADQGFARVAGLIAAVDRLQALVGGAGFKPATLQS